MRKIVLLARCLLAVWLLGAIGAPAFCCYCTEPGIWLSTTIQPASYRVCVGEPVAVTVTSATDNDLVDGVYPSCTTVADNVYVSFYKDGELKSGPTLKEPGVNIAYTTTFSTAGTHVILVSGDDTPGQYNDAPYPRYFYITVYNRSWNAQADFVVSSNPNGVWRYGYAPNLDSGYILTLYNTGVTYADPPVAGLERRYHSSLGTNPSVTRNPTDQDIDDGNGSTWPPHTLALHPGSIGQKSIVRWTAPMTRSYAITARFWDITDGHTSTDVHVLRNRSPLFDGEIKNLNEGPTPRVSQPVQSYSAVLQLNANDVIDFAVGRGNDDDYTLDTTGLDAMISVVPTSGDLRFDRGMPTANLNNAAGPNRSNIRWADADPDMMASYGDDLVLPSGNWVIDTIRVWGVPDLPVSPDYCLGQHYQSITLYGGGTAGGLSALSSGSFTYWSNTTSNPSISIMPWAYQGGASYQTASGDYNQIWQIEFQNLNLELVGGTTYVFGVHAVPRVDRLWFSHATDSAVTGGNGQLWYFDTGNLGANPSAASGSAWFGGKGSDINVQVYARPQ